MNTIDLKHALKLLGPTGLREGLRASEITTREFSQFIKKSKLKLPDSESRDEFILAIVSHYDRSLLKKTEDLMLMSFEELTEYFAATAPSNDDLMKIMKELNYKVSAENKKHLRRFVARQISETALFSNVATRQSGDKEK